MILKKVGTALLGFSIMFTFAGHPLATENKQAPVEEKVKKDKDEGIVVQKINKEVNPLNSKEIEYLLNIGHTEQEIAELPVDIARQLVIDKAELKNKSQEIRDIYEIPTSPDEYQAMGEISKSQLKLGAAAYKVTSDRSGYDKFHFYGNFDWITKPIFTLVDGLTLGFPESAGFFLPMSNGSVTQHSHRVSVDPQGNGNWTDFTDYSADYWDPSAGVGGHIDIRGDTEFTDNKGYISQYVYIPTTRSGTINLKYQYGHKRISGSVGFSVYPAGVAITPQTTVDTQSYGLEVAY